MPQKSENDIPVSEVPPRAGTQSFERTILLLRLVGNAGPKGRSLKQLLEGSSLQRPTAVRMLNALQRSNLIASMLIGGERFYFLGDYCRELAASYADSSGIRSVCLPALERISEATGNSSLLVRRIENDAICVARVVGSYPIQVLSVRVGSRQPLGVGAGGLSILAKLPSTDQRRAIGANEKRLHSYGGLDVPLLKAMVSASQKRGYAVIGHFSVPGVIGIGLTIHNGQGDILGAITTSSIDARMTVRVQSEAVKIMRTEVARIQNQLDSMKSVDL